MRNIKIGIADDHSLFRNGLITMLSSFAVFEVRVEAGSGKELLEKLNRNKVDVVLMDISMPGMDGVEATKIIKRDYKQIQVIAVSGLKHPHYLRKMLEVGAKGFVRKTADPKDLFAAIHAVHKGKMFLCPDSMQVMISNSLHHPNGQKFQLNDRQEALLQLILDEKSDAEISKAMGFSLKTIAKQKKGLMDDVGATSMVGLIKWAFAHDPNNWKQ